MRILVSAYSCEPNRGSEPGIGWEWCYQFASLGNETWAITRGASRAPIEAALKDSIPRTMAEGRRTWPVSLLLYLAVRSILGRTKVTSKDKLRCGSAHNVWQYSPTQFSGSARSSVYLWSRWRRRIRSDGVAENVRITRSNH